MQHAWSLSLRLKHRDKEMGLSHGQTGIVCFSLLLCRALGLRACPELAFWLSQSHEAQESKLLWPPGPGGPESRKLLYTRCGLCWPPGFSKDEGGQDTQDAHWRQGKPGAWARLGDRAGVGVPVAVMAQQHIEGGDECWEQSEPAALLRLCPHLRLHKRGTGRMQEWHSAVPPSPGKS